MSLSARMPDLPALEVLLKVGEHGSLSAAARDLGLTQQAVSARIASLEAQTGVRLVRRTPRGSQLTEAGAAASHWADRLLRMAHEVDIAFASLREGARSRLRVSASLTIAEHLLPRWLVSLRDASLRRGGEAAEIVLHVTNSDQVQERVRAGNADLGFIEGPRVPSGLRSRVVTQDELVLVVPSGHSWARRRTPIAAEELARTPLVTREPGSGTRDALAAALAAALGADHVQAPPALEMSTVASVRAAVIAGAAPAVLSLLAVDGDLACGRLRAVPAERLDLRRDLRAVWVGSRTPPAGAIRDLLAHINAQSSR